MNSSLLDLKWLEYLLFGLLFINIMSMCYYFIHKSWHNWHFRQLTTLSHQDVLRWGNTQFQDKNYNSLRIMEEDSDYFVVALLQPLPRNSRGTPPHDFFKVYKDRHRESQIENFSEYPGGLGIK